MSLKKPAAVLFDLDGTLADTAQDLGGALNSLLQEEGMPSVAYERIRPIASHGARGLIELGFGIDKAHAQFDDYRQRFLNHYEHMFCDRTVLFDGVNSLIQQLEAQGIRWGIVTNKPMRFTDRLVPKLGFLIEPGTVVSGDTVGVAKPDPKPMYHAAAELGVAPSDCWYVGDAQRDIDAGKAAGMFTVLANYGYISSTDTPTEWGADITIDQPAQLITHIPQG
ncbi:HAD-IA family hydrolase [Leeia sp. TBRC 13508]|uniref:HAD-IA family hydrolase n=1 Tax=Leeia speluncae TaxID=2884804 RepID=A0ABS8D4J8_9NEIS|nr:HAD-IA family hydrolase [Leeia speluncae]MCB6183130.1 HAD-IA family hydrolase [Leeia speluncae]